MPRPVTLPPSNAVDVNLLSGRLDRGRVLGLILAGAILMFGLALRLVDLAGPSFWWDDSYSAMVAAQGLRDIVSTLAREDFHPPLYYFLLHYWMRLVGTSEFALRYLSVLAGVLAVAAAWPAGRRLFGQPVAPLSAGLFAISPFLWYYSQEARMFALVPLFGTLAIYFCARAADDRRLASWTGYAVACTLGVYSFYYFMFVPLACGVWVGTSTKRARLWRDWLVATAVVVVLYLPWLPIFLSRNAAWSNGSPSLASPVKIVTWSWPELLLGLPSLALYREALPTALLSLGALATLGALTWGLAIRSRIRTRVPPLPLGEGWGEGVPPKILAPGQSLPAIAFVVPFVAMAAVSVVKPVFHPRYAIPLEAGLLLALAGFVGFLVGQGGSRRAVGVGVAVLLVVCSGYGLTRLRSDGNYARDDYRSAIGYVLQNERPGDTVIHNAVPPFWYYYHGPAPAAYFPTGPYTEADIAAALNQVTRDRTRLWYVTQSATPNDPDGFVDALLRLHAARLEEHGYGALRVQLWAIPGDDAFAGPAFQPIAATLANELAITGYSTVGDPIGGRPLDVELRIEARRVPSADDGFWVGLFDRAGHEWGRADAQPHDAAYSSSSRWTVGTTVIVRTDVPVAVGTPPGVYDLVAGGYHLRDLVGLDALDPQGHPIGQQVRLGVVQIKQPSESDADPAMTGQSPRVVAPGLVLIASQLNRTTAGPGDPVTLTLLWRSTAALAAMHASVELRDSGGHAVIHDDGLVGGPFTTDHWTVGRPVREQRSLTIPATVTGDTDDLVLVPAGGEAIPLGTLKLNQVTRDFTPPSPSHPLAAVYGQQIDLIGYGLGSDSVTVGGSVALTLDWHALRTPATGYHVFVHLIDARDQIITQWDGVPRNWTYPTSAWVPGEYVVDHYTLAIPPNAPAESLRIEVGLYDPVNGQRLSVVDPSDSQTTDRVLVAQVRVIP